MPFTYYDDCALQLSPDTVCSLGSVPVALLGQGLLILPTNINTCNRRSQCPFSLGYPDLTTPIAQDLQVYLWPRSHMSYEENFIDWAVATIVNATTVTYVTSAREYHYKKLFVQLWNPYFGNVTSLPLLEVRAGLCSSRDAINWRLLRSAWISWRTPTAVWARSRLRFSRSMVETSSLSQPLVTPLEPHIAWANHATSNLNNNYNRLPCTF